MSAKMLPPSLPPSSRNFDVFRFLLVQGGSTREAAAAFGISQSRVRQIAQRVAEWEAQALPPENEIERAKSLRLAEHLAADRLQHFFEQTMAMWRGTQQCKYLGMALRVTQAQAKMAASSHTLEALVADANEEPLEELDAKAVRGYADEPSEPDDDRQDALTADIEKKHSPVRDCSPAHVPIARSLKSADERRGATPPQISRLQQLAGEKPWQAQEREERVRALLSQPDAAALAGVSATAESLGLSVDDALAKSRRLRRKAR